MVGRTWKDIQIGNEIVYVSFGKELIERIAWLNQPLESLSENLSLSHQTHHIKIRHGVTCIATRIVKCIVTCISHVFTCMLSFIVSTPNLNVDMNINISTLRLDVDTIKPKNKG